MKEKFQFIYYTLGKFENITVCLAIKGDNEALSRGITIRSIKDDPDEKKGQDESRKNALKAMGGAKIDPIKNKDARYILRKTKCPFVIRGERNPRLTWQEMSLLKQPNAFFFSGKVLSLRGLAKGGIVHPSYHHMHYDRGEGGGIPEPPPGTSPQKYPGGDKIRSKITDRIILDDPLEPPPSHVRCRSSVKGKRQYEIDRERNRIKHGMRLCSPKGLQARMIRRPYMIPREFRLRPSEIIQNITKQKDLEGNTIFFIETSDREMVAQC